MLGLLSASTVPFKSNIFMVIALRYTLSLKALNFAINSVKKLKKYRVKIFLNKFCINTTDGTNIPKQASSYIFIS